jgi:hypothetical protein
MEDEKMILTMEITPMSVALTVIGSLMLIGFLVFVWYLHSVWTDFRTMALTRIKTKLKLTDDWRAVRKWQTWEAISVVYLNHEGKRLKVVYKLRGGKEVLEVTENGEEK